MTTSQRTFEQVKNILGKLDRDIDAARAKRLQTRAMPPTAAVATLGGVSGVPGIPSLIPARPLATPAPGISPFGRATPMRMEQRTQSQH
mgnify:CR=1 FL=1